MPRDDAEILTPGMTLMPNPIPVRAYLARQARRAPTAAGDRFFAVVVQTSSSVKSQVVVQALGGHLVGRERLLTLSRAR